jgi:hypothetical protein
MGPAQPAPARAPSGSFLLGAAAPTATALAVPGEPYTAFTAELIDLLDHGIPDDGPVLRMETVVTRLDEVLHRKSRPRPWPVAAGGGSRIVLARNTAPWGQRSPWTISSTAKDTSSSSGRPARERRP